MPEQFGAKGDGTTDDTAAFQALAAAATGQVIGLKSDKTYRLTSSVACAVAKVRGIVGNNALVAVDGDFTAFAFTGTHTGSANPSESTVAKRSAEFFPVVHNVRVRGVTGGTTGEAFSFTQTMEPRITSCYLFELKTGVRIYGQNRNIVVSGNTIYHCTTGIHFDGGNLHQTILSGNHISYCRKAIYSRNVSQHNTLIVGNDIEAGGGSTPGGVAQNLVHIGRDSATYDQEKWQFVGNQFDDHETLTGLDMATKVGVVTNNCTDYLFSGNTFANALNGCIRADYVMDIAVTGNTFRAWGGWAVDIQKHVIGVLIADNVVDGRRNDSSANGFARVVADDSFSSAAKVTDNVIREMWGQVFVAAGTAAFLNLDYSGNQVQIADIAKTITEPLIDIAAGTVRALNVVGNQFYGRAGTSQAMTASSPVISSGIIRDNVAYDAVAKGTSAFTLPAATATLKVADNIGWN
ncbi:NosD domain-containing protein [Blastococcus sp. SYSU DS0617]